MTSPLPSAVILAGGTGRRMGGNKPLYMYEGRTLIDAVIDRLTPQVDRLFIGCGTVGHAHGKTLAEKAVAIGIPPIFDSPHLGDLGPLSGVYTALRLAEGLGEPSVVTAPCDMPGLPADMVARLTAAHDQTVDISYFSGARDYPLCAIWNVTVLPALEAALDQARPHGGLAVMAWLKTRNVRKIAVTDDASFVNINQPVGGAPRA